MATNAIKTASLHQMKQHLENGPSLDLIDVRTPAEFREVHATPARNVPLDTLDPQAIMAGRSDSAPLYVLCKSGMRAGKACEQFIAAGFPDVISIEGGTDAWVQAGLPVERGRKTISLERQVRIAAGLLVLVGALLAMTVHPYFAAISAFVGTGLIFAGVTDSCGMAMLLAKMPWNRVS